MAFGSTASRTLYLLFIGLPNIGMVLGILVSRWTDFNAYAGAMIGGLLGAFACAATVSVVLFCGWLKSRE